MTNQVYYTKAAVHPAPLMMHPEKSNPMPTSSANIMFHPSLAMIQNTATVAAAATATNHQAMNPANTINHMAPSSSNSGLNHPHLGGYVYPNVGIQGQENVQAANSSILSSPLSSPSSIYFIPTDHPIPEFLHQLTKMLSDAENSHMISWIDKRIVVHDPPGLTSKVFHKYFRHSNYASFQRQLNYFGFRKVTGKKGKMHPCSYVHDLVTNDLRSLLAIKRKNTKKSNKSSSSSSSNNNNTSTNLNNINNVEADVKSKALSESYQAQSSDPQNANTATQPLHAMAVPDCSTSSNPVVVPQSGPTSCSAENGLNFTDTDVSIIQNFISQNQHSQQSKKRNCESVSASISATQSQYSSDKPDLQHSIGFDMNLSQYNMTNTGNHNNTDTTRDISRVSTSEDQQTNKKQKTIHKGENFHFPSEETQESNTTNMCDTKTTTTTTNNNDTTTLTTTNNSNTNNKCFGDYASIIMDPKLYASIHYPRPSFPNLTKSSLADNDKFFDEQNHNEANSNSMLNNVMQNFISQPHNPTASSEHDLQQNKTTNTTITTTAITTTPSPPTATENTTIPTTISSSDVVGDKSPSSSIDALKMVPSMLPHPFMEYSHFEFVDLEKDLRTLESFFQQNQSDTRGGVTDQLQKTKSIVSDDKQLNSSSSSSNNNDDLNDSPTTIDLLNHTNINQMVAASQVSPSPPTCNSSNDNGQDDAINPNTLSTTSNSNNGLATNVTGTTSSSIQSVEEDNLCDIEELDGFSFSLSKDKSFDLLLYKNANTLGNDDTNHRIDFPTTIKHKANSSNSLVHTYQTERI